jgi:hypothetical protein
MSKTRMVRTDFWSDKYIVELDPSEKLAFIYLFTNARNNLCGMYQLSEKLMSFECGFDPYVTKNILERFEKDGKIKRVDGWVAIKNNIKNQAFNNPKIITGINREVSELKPPTELLDFVEQPGDFYFFDYEKKPSRKELPQGQRKRILDKFDNTCSECPSSDELEIDHIVPLCDGGSNDDENLQVLCNDCHIKKTSKENSDRVSKKNDRVSHEGVKYSKVNIIVNNIYEHWNTKGIVKHSKVPSKLSTKLNSLLKDLSEDEIIKAIDNYATVFHSKKTYWNHKWTLEEFIGRANGARVFVDKKESDYLSGNISEQKKTPEHLSDTSKY